MKGGPSSYTLIDTGFRKVLAIVVMLIAVLGCLVALAPVGGGATGIGQLFEGIGQLFEKRGLCTAREFPMKDGPSSFTLIDAGLPKFVAIMVILIAVLGRAIAMVAVGCGAQGFVSSSWRWRWAWRGTL